MASARTDAGDALVSATPARRSMHSRATDIALRLALYLSLPFFLLLWQLLSTSGAVNRILTPAPSDVITAIGRALRDGTLLIDVAWSAARVVVGYVVGAVLGVLAGLLTA